MKQRIKPKSTSATRARKLAAALDDTRAALVRFVSFAGPEYPRLLALWVAHCHAIEAAYATPVVHVYSPAPESGKTTLLEVLRDLLPEGQGLLDVDMSPAALYRLLGNADDNGEVKFVPLLDEADAIFRPGSERGEALRPIINQGYRRGGYVHRCIPPNHQPERFYVFSPKVIAGLDNGAMPSTIVSRRLPVPLQTALPEERIEEYEDITAQPILHPIRDRLATALDPLIDKLTGARPDGLDGLRRRQVQVIRPLIAIADAAGREWAEQAREDAFAVFEAAASDQEATAALKLLSDVRDVFKSSKADKLRSEDLRDALNDLEERSYAHWNKGAGLDVNDLARMLKPFGIAPVRMYVDVDGERIQRRGYKQADFRDAWKRYCPTKPLTAFQSRRPSPPSPRLAQDSKTPPPRQDGKTAKTSPRKRSPFPKREPVT